MCALDENPHSVVIVRKQKMTRIYVWENRGMWAAGSYLFYLSNGQNGYRHTLFKTGIYFVHSLLSWLNLRSMFLLHQKSNKTTKNSKLGFFLIISIS